MKIKDRLDMMQHVITEANKAICVLEIKIAHIEKYLKEKQKNGTI